MLGESFATSESESPRLRSRSSTGRRLCPASPTRTEGSFMKPSTRDQTRGKFENLKGKIKEAAGIITGHRKLEAEGKDQKLVGKAREKLGQVKKVLGK